MMNTGKYANIPSTLDTLHMLITKDSTAYNLGVVSKSIVSVLNTFIDKLFLHVHCSISKSSLFNTLIFNNRYLTCREEQHSTISIHQYAALSHHLWKIVNM